MPIDRFVKLRNPARFVSLQRNIRLARELRPPIQQPLAAVSATGFGFPNILLKL
jgi:hypothetical protein